MITPNVVAVVGPTAVGKSALAVEIATYLLDEKKVSGVDIISADSRQVYQGLEIVTGADVPADLNPAISFHGVSLIKPDQEWSVMHFQQLARAVITVARLQNRAVIIVGGTGLYHQQLFNEDPRLSIPPNLDLRAHLEQLTLPQLQAELQKKTLSKFNNMTHSDQHNPRRLIRALEIGELPTQTILPQRPSLPTVGLTDDLEALHERIKARVQQRFESGAIQEVERLIADYENWSMPAFSATGVKELRQYIEGMLDRDQCLELWSRREFQYAKRQLTWWKKQTQATWLEVTQPQLLKTAILSLW